MQHKIRTWTWVLSANFSEGLPYTIINVLLVNLLADMGCSNGLAAMIPSLLALPWTWKFLWSPLIDTHSTKRRWMITMQVLMTALFLTIALTLSSTWWLYTVIACSALAAMASATYDISCDGYYMIVLPPNAQAFFVGIRSTAYRLGMLFASGYLIILAKDGSSAHWQRTFLVTAGLMALLAILHIFILPREKNFHKHFLTRETAESETTTQVSVTQSRSITAVFRSFVQLHPWKELVFIFCFILFYRLGEAFLGKVSILFLKDDACNGGLGLDNEQYGFIYGTFGTLSLIIGGIAGGICISKWGLRRCLLPMVLALDIPDLLYVWLSSAPLLTDIADPNRLYVIGACVSIEQFGYGFGLTAFTVYLLQCAKGPFQTSHYAFLTALMAIGLLLPSTLSGYLQEYMNSYYYYFILTCMLTIPGILLSIYYVRSRNEQVLS